MKPTTTLFILLAMGIAGCLDTPDFSYTPKISYNGISQRTRTDSVDGAPVGKTDIVTVTVKFEDGDGDLGASSAEVQDTLIFTKSYQKVPGWNLEANWELVTMVQNKDSTWSESILNEDKFKFFPLLKKDGKAGPMEGKLDLNIPFHRHDNAVPTRIKYKIRIADRAFHISNQIETDPIIVYRWR